MTFQHLRITGGAMSGRGDGISDTSGGNLTLTACAVSGNTSADFGGGIYKIGGTLTMTGCTVSMNSAAGYGGGIYNHGPMTLTRCTVTANDAGTGSNNTARLQGGGIMYDTGRLNLINGSRVMGNHAGIDGGGIFNYGTVAYSGSTVSGSTKGASNLTSNCVNTGSGTGCGTCPA